MKKTFYNFNFTHQIHTMKQTGTHNTRKGKLRNKRKDTKIKEASFRVRILCGLKCNCTNLTVNFTFDILKG